MAKPRIQRTDAQRAAEKRAKLAKMYPKYAKRAQASLERLGKLARYNPTEAQVNVIVGVIQNAAKSAEAILRGTARATEVPTLPQ